MLFRSAGDPAILGIALALSSLGDVLLDLPRWGGFVRGLVAFLLAHLVYIALFARNFRRPLRPRLPQLLLIGLVLLYSLTLSAWFAPSLGPMANPVMIYICTITTMVVWAILAGFSRPWVWIGAVLFLISDSLIAVNRFKMHLPMRGPLIWRDRKSTRLNSSHLVIS